MPDFSLSTRRVMVTGANGWLGRVFVKNLLQGFADDWGYRPATGLTVRCLVMPGEDTSFLRALSPAVEIVEGDLADAEACRRFVGNSEGLLFHLAGIVHPRRSSDFFAINEGGTRNLLAAVDPQRLTRFVHMSSNSPCGCNPDPRELFDEQSPYNPYMNYGRSKMMAELAVKEAGEKRGVKWSIVRAPWFYGPLAPPRQALFFSMIRNGRVPVVGNGENTRSMAYLDNLCQGLLLAAERPQALGKAYWIADREPYSMNTIIETVASVFESLNDPVKRGRVALPWFVGQIAQAIDWTLQKLGLYHQKMHVLSEMNKTIACSVAGAERDLGYAPKVALREGMRRSIEWSKSQNESL